MRGSIPLKAVSVGKILIVNFKSYIRCAFLKFFVSRWSIAVFDNPTVQIKHMQFRKICTSKWVQMCPLSAEDFLGTHPVGCRWCYFIDKSFQVQHMHLTNRMMSISTVFSGSGGMAPPFLIGRFIDDNPMILMHVCSVIAVALTTVMIGK